RMGNLDVGHVAYDYASNLDRNWRKNLSIIWRCCIANGDPPLDVQLLERAARPDRGLVEGLAALWLVSADREAGGQRRTDKVRVRIEWREPILDVCHLTDSRFAAIRQSAW